MELHFVLNELFGDLNWLKKYAGNSCKGDFKLKFSPKNYFYTSNSFLDILL